MLTHRDKSVKIQNISDEERKKQERIRDILLLLEQLVEREEITLKLIVDCLYDIGSVNIVNKRFPNRTTNKLLKGIAVMSKPVFRIVALRWVKKNLPILVTNWLNNKVSFK